MYVCISSILLLLITICCPLPVGACTLKSFSWSLGGLCCQGLDINFLHVAMHFALFIKSDPFPEAPSRVLPPGPLQRGWPRPLPGPCVGVPPPPFQAPVRAACIKAAELNLPLPHASKSDASHYHMRLCSRTARYLLPGWPPGIHPGIFRQGLTPLYIFLFLFI